MKKKLVTFKLVLLLLIVPATTAQAMHISEGFLPPVWAGLYFVLSAPFFYIGLRQIKAKTMNNKDLKMLLGLAAAYSFILSAMKLPSITGSCSHATGTGFGAILFGPFVMAVIGTLVLLFQAIFLAHGGITTLGANVFSMGIIGPIVSYIVYKIFKNVNKKWAVFFAAMLGDLATYLTTSVQLALSFPAKDGGVMVSFIKFVSIFAITQIPLSIVEGVLTVIIFEFIEKYSKDEMHILSEVK